MGPPNPLYHRRALRDFLNHLTVIPIDQIEEEERICGICYEHYDSELPHDRASSSQEHESASTSVSCYSLMGFNPFSEDETTPPDNIIVKTEIWVETQVVVETYTVYQKHHGHIIDKSADADPEGHVTHYDQPVRLPCGHIFGRNCLHAWSVSIQLRLFEY